MAELGDIKHVNVNQGTQVVDRSGEARALAQGLNAGKAIVDEAITAKVTGDMIDAIAETDSPQAPPEQPDFDPDSREAYLSNKMDRLQAVIEQGSVSQQTLAEMQVKKVLAEAQTNFPWLYENLQRRAGAVITGSVRMEQLGIEDAIRAADAKKAQKDYNDIVDHARASWDEGGLGISPEVSPNTPYFARLYKERQALRIQEEEGARRVSMAAANAKLDIYDPAFYDSMEYEMFQGSISAVAGSYQALADRHEWERFLTERNKGAAGDLQFIEQWKAVYTEGWKRDIALMKAQLQDVWNNHILTIHPDMLSTDRGKMLETRYKGAIAELDAQSQLIEQVKDDIAGADTTINRMLAMRRNDVFLDLPTSSQDELAFFSGPVGGKMLELMAQMKNPQGLAIMDQISISAQTAFSKRFPEIFDPTNPNYDATVQLGLYASSGALNISPDAGPAEIEAAINRAMKNPKNTWIVPTANGEEETIMALRTANMHMGLLRTAQGTLTTADAEFANNSLLGLTYSLSYLNDGESPPNVEDEVLNSLADGSLDTAVNISLSGESHGRRQAFGVAAEKFYHTTKPFETRRAMDNHYNGHRIGGVLLSDLVVINVDALEEGIFKWEVADETKYDQAAQSLGVIGPSGKSSLEEGRRRLQDKINQEMMFIKNEMDRQIAIEMLINKAKAADENNLTQQNEWTAFFLGVGDPAGSQQAWANLFKYTQSGSVSRDR